MKYVNIAVRNKIARTDEEQAQIVCGNSDYTIKFDFDEEWGAETVKTARFIFASNGKYIDVQFSGDECHMPVISDTTSVLVGVFAGNLCTTTGGPYSLYSLYHRSRRNTRGTYPRCLRSTDGTI